MDEHTSEPASSGPGDIEKIKPAKFVPHKSAAPRRKIPFNTKLFLLAGAIILGSAFILFLFTARAVYLNTQPADTDSSVASLFSLKLADRYLLLSGKHTVTVTAPGYKDLEKVIEVTDEQSQEFSITLEKLPGHLQVDSGTVTGAVIIIDGEKRGKTPATARELRPGKHSVIITAERYFPFETEVEIDGLDQTQSLQATLVPAWAEASFTSQPAGAEVFVDDKNTGQTPLKTEIIEGNRTISIRLTGYKQWQRVVSVTAGEALAFDDIVLQPADAVVKLSTSPAGASTTLDGTYIGLTPVEIAVAPGKPATASLFKQGYLPAKRTFTLQSGEQQQVTIKLLPELVSVSFNIQPADASLYINGKLQANTNTTLKLPAITQNVVVKKKGYVDVTKVISPRAGMDQEVRIRLKSVAEVRKESVKPSITTASGQLLKLFYPGSFTAGASRREAGRRANETIQDISLTRAFYLGEKEVTNAGFREFKKDHASGVVQGNTLNADPLPVVNVTWNEAARYCNWLSSRDKLTPFYKINDKIITGFNAGANGYRLPSEAEWAWAARVLPDNSMLKFPWGSKMPPPKKHGNYADISSATILGNIIGNYDDGYPVTAPTGSFAPSVRGLYDIGGNVSEWIHDFYDISVAVSGKVKTDPLGPDSGEFHVIRGSSWAHGTIRELRLSYRDYGIKGREDVGFRLARYLD